MNARAVLIPFAALVLIAPAGAHRMDEYLQATRLSVSLDRVDLEIDLTPGIALASRVFSWIDADQDGEISGVEGQTYARRMLDSVVLKIDGWPAPVVLLGASFPRFQEMSLGVGTIRLRAAAKIPQARAGRHQLSFLNTHRPEWSVYLINALVPENPRVQLEDQRRDRQQHGLTLDYSVAGDAPSDRTFAALLGLALAGTLFLRCVRPAA